MVWDKNKPAGSQKLRLSDDELRANNAAIEAAFDLDHDFTTGGTQTGEHYKVTLQKQDADPGQEADKGKLYTKIVDGEVELFYRDKTAAHILQLTRAGGHALFASGDKIIAAQDVAPTGWTIIDTLDDKLVYVTKGKTAGGSPGGEEVLSHFHFDAGINAEDLQELDTIRKAGGGSWSCRLRSIEYAGTAPNQTGVIYYDQLTGGTPADDESIEDNNGRGFTATVNGSVTVVSWTISGISAASQGIGTIILDSSLHSGNYEFTVPGNLYFDTGDYQLIASDTAPAGGPQPGYNARKFVEARATNTGNHSHTISQNSLWRPKAHACIVIQKD